VQSAALLLGGVSGPLVGWAFDRLGPGRLFQGGAVLGVLAFALASRVDSLPLLVLTYGVLGGLALAALGSQANLILAALWYPGARGRAIAVADLGTGFGAFCFIPLGQALVSALGWRETLLVWAALLMLIVLPLSAFQRLPGDGHAGRLAPREPPAAWTVAGAIRSRPFWWLAATRLFSAFAFPVLNVHMVAYAIDQGIAPARAATALGAVSLVSLAGRLTTGVLCDRLGRAETLTITYASAAAGIGCLVLLRMTAAPWWLALYVLFYGMAQGSTGIVHSARAADVFAGASFGSIYGWLALAVGPGEALGAWLGGTMYDVWGSYLPAFGVVVLALAAGVVSMWRVRVPVSETRDSGATST